MCVMSTVNVQNQSKTSTKTCCCSNAKVLFDSRVQHLGSLERPDILYQLHVFMYDRLHVNITIVFSSSQPRLFVIGVSVCVSCLRSSSITRGCCDCSICFLLWLGFIGSSHMHCYLASLVSRQHDVLQTTQTIQDKPAERLAALLYIPKDRGNTVR